MRTPIFARPFVWVHEICHYVPAAAFGLSPEIDGDKTYSDKGEWWQDFIVSAMPTLAGLILLRLVVWGYEQTDDIMLFVLGAWFSIGWIMACAADWWQMSCHLVRIKDDS